MKIRFIYIYKLLKNIITVNVASLILIISQYYWIFSYVFGYVFGLTRLRFES